MKKILLITFIFILVLLFILIVLYALVILKMKNMNKRTFRYKEEKNLKDENILIIYQQSPHKSTNEIANVVKNEVLDKGYGYYLHTLTKEKEDYSNYKDVVIITPVYFAKINDYLLQDLPKRDFVIIYCGMNKDSNKEDIEVKELHKGTYRPIKVTKDELDRVKDFIKGAIK